MPISNVYSYISSDEKLMLLWFHHDWQTLYFIHTLKVIVLYIFFILTNSKWILLVFLVLEGIYPEAPLPPFVYYCVCVYYYYNVILYNGRRTSCTNYRPSLMSSQMFFFFFIVSTGRTYAYSVNNSEPFLDNLYSKMKNNDSPKCRMYIFLYDSSRDETVAVISTFFSQYLCFLFNLCLTGQVHFIT